MLSQNLPKSSSDATLQAIADQYGISLGKASLIHTLTASNPLLSEEGLAALSINELNLLLAAQENPQQSDIQSVSTASDKRPISGRIRRWKPRWPMRGFPKARSR